LQSGTGIDQTPPSERCILAGLDIRKLNRGPSVLPTGLLPEQSLDELAELASSAGAEVVGMALQTREKPSPATLLGIGKVRELQAWASEADCDFVLIDRDLTPSQHRNLEREIGRPVLDRTQLILDIFAKHARSKTGRLQVELAQLEYLLPRLAGRGSEMSRLGGGIGTRGPGETKLEHDRRKIRGRIVKLRRDLRRVRATRRLQRSNRDSVPVPTVALCGYTNAGKSTLFNRLTRSRVVADARMFATLDPTIRKLRTPSGNPTLLSDTVGFIRDLPPTLIEAFAATLEEVAEAALIVHVVDITAENRDVHTAEVNGVLKKIGAAQAPQILVLNKSDLNDPDENERVVELGRAAGWAREVVAVSAKTGAGLDQLLEVVDAALAEGLYVRRQFRLPFREGAALAALYEHGRVVTRREDAGGVEVLADVTPALADRMARFEADVGAAAHVASRSRG